MTRRRAVFRLDRQQVQEAVTGRDSIPYRALVRLMRRVAARAKREAPVRTRELRNSIGWSPISVRRLSLQSGVFAKARHAKWVHDGTRPHLITARRARVLAFQADGRTVFARQVRHPGTRPNPFMRRAADIETRHLT